MQMIHSFFTLMLNDLRYKCRLAGAVELTSLPIVVTTRTTTRASTLQCNVRLILRGLLNEPALMVLDDLQLARHPHHIIRPRPWSIPALSLVFYHIFLFKKSFLYSSSATFRFHLTFR